MPLRDHFRSPVNDRHSWDELHGGWPMEMVRDLNSILPSGYRAAPQVHLGTAFEVDVGSFELDATAADTTTDDGLCSRLAVQAPTLTVEADLADLDEYEVRIYDADRGRELVATIEIVSPANKDRPDSRDKFISKCLALLQRGICVSIVDLVTVRNANLYVELLERIGRTDPKVGSEPPGIYSVTLRTRMPLNRRELLDAWFFPMTVGQPLPTLPIWLTADLHVSLPLDASYEETCRVLRIA